MKNFAIIGGGFSGTMTAVNIARFSEVPLHVTVINQSYPSGRGVAYSTRRPEHLLIVAARNMSALPDQPNHFVEWLRSRTEFADTPEAELRESFMPRRIYGDYVRSLRLHYARPLDPRGKVETTFVEDEAMDVEPTSRGVQIRLASGQAIEANRIVLATGNEMPAELPGGADLKAHPGYAANPWVEWETKLPSPAENIVLLGTGLTAVDAIITLLALDWKGTILAVSRNGLLPQSHFKGRDYPDFPPATVDLTKLGLKGMVTLISEYCERLRVAGENPAIVIDKMRPHTQRVWQAFSLADQREFAARYAARWNVMRHRIAPSIHQKVSHALEAGRLKIVRGQVVRLESQGSRVRVQLQAAAADGNGSAPAETCIEGALVINCTGPQTRFSAARSPLLRNLLERGMVQPDAMDMGIRIDPEYAAIERDGAPSVFLRVIGPLLRGTYWETVAVPELRGQALRLAQLLLAGADAHTLYPWATPTEPAVIEYWI